MTDHATSREHYHQKMFDLIAENLKRQGYTAEELRQYNLDRDKGLSEVDAMKRLRGSVAA
jgi:hypothetical protein